MPRLRAIPENEETHAEIMRRVAEGQGTQEIADWLSAKLGRLINRKHISDLVTKIRTARAPLVEAAVKEGVEKTAFADLGVIGRLLSDAHEIQCDNQEDKPNVALRAIAEQRELIKLRFSLLGIGDEPNVKHLGSVIILPPEED